MVNYHFDPVWTYLLTARSPVVPILSAFVGLICLFALWRCFTYPSIPGSIAISLCVAYLTVKSYIHGDHKRRLVCILLAGLLLGVSASIHITNSFMVFGYVVVFGLAIIKRPSIETIARTFVFGLAFVVGLLPVLTAQWINAGSPLATTYGPMDANTPTFGWANIIAGLDFYFVASPLAAAYLLIAAVLLGAIAFFQNQATPEQRQVLSIAILNYLSIVSFFVLHFPRNDYYVLPVAIHAIGIAVFIIVTSQSERAMRQNLARSSLMLRIACSLIIGAFLIVRLWSLSFPISPDFLRPKISIALEPNTVVWAGLYDGYFHYFLGRQASVLYFVTPDIQDRIVAAVMRDGRKQLIVEDEYTRSLAMDNLKKTYSFKPVGEAFGAPVFEIEPPQKQ